MSVHIIYGVVADDRLWEQFEFTDEHGMLENLVWVEGIVDFTCDKSWEDTYFNFYIGEVLLGIDESEDTEIFPLSKIKNCNPSQQQIDSVAEKLSNFKLNYPEQFEMLPPVDVYVVWG